MKLFIKAFFSVVLLVVTATVFGYFLWYRPKFNHDIKHVLSPEATNVNASVMLRLKQKAASIKVYNQADDYNSEYCFLVDMKIPSGRKRFFVYNLKKDSVELSGLVTHGSGSDKGTSGLYFSNKPNSNCTSLGKYKIGNSYYGKFGLAFKLYGLDITNSNAFDRFVVLHAHSCVADDEIDPLPICESWGCPTVSPTFLTALKKNINDSDKPLLLWIYY